MTTPQLEAVTLRPIHNHGFVALSTIAGNELSIVNSARVSFANYKEEMDDSDRGLIRYLLKHKHGTPFEMVWLRWHIKAPIFLFREWHRHRMASINEMSGRYVELKPEFYLPDDNHVRAQVGKSGHYTYQSVGDYPVVMDSDTEATNLTLGAMTRAHLENAYRDAYGEYEYLLHLGIAREIARACLPVAIYSEMYWACNLRSLLNFLSLRNHSRAMRELRDYASVMESITTEYLPVVMMAFAENDRIAP